MRALDVTLTGIRLPVLLVAVTHHPSTHYVIARGLIYSRAHRWCARTYDGPDPHTSHAHISILTSRYAAYCQQPWWVVEPKV